MSVRMHGTNIHPGTVSARGSLVGKGLVTFVAGVTMVGPFLADWNATHLFNPLWPPHARFHGAQTMLLGLGLGACALGFTWWSGRDAGPRPRTGMLFASLYWLAQLGSIAFPGTAFVDPERAGTGQVLGIPAQVVLSAVLLGLLCAASLLERRRAVS
ncbi:acetyltransferase [Myxococcus sp. CA056]|uniref:DUF6640 family protein n=1 Tax=Myxococcus sp. CA056 TaxID=2741740 RepID=UPI00157ABCD6|nr:DUF6640 family protein [Myxococcus sp. CA056]NTX11357.1 acetyltransferase [Myxococcus sp. CA056]